MGEEWSILGKRASEFLRTDDVLVDFNICKIRCKRSNECACVRNRKIAVAAGIARFGIDERPVRLLKLTTIEPSGQYAESYGVGAAGSYAHV